MSEVHEAVVIGSEEEAPVIAMTPQQQAEDIMKRQTAFNEELKGLLGKHHFNMGVMRQDLPNGFVFGIQLFDTKFAPKAPTAPIEEEGAEEVGEAPEGTGHAPVVDESAETLDETAGQAA